MSDARGATTVDRVRVRVPAKVNLFLAVRGRRDDGMHEIVSVMHTVGLWDVLSVSLEGARGHCFHPAARRHMEIALEHDGGEAVPSGGDNLAVIAARTLGATLAPAEAEHDERAPEGAPVTRLRLHKRIPVGAGMAGGSADAAGTLVALNRLWDLGLMRDDLQEYAARIGADVPFCVAGGTALATGTGVATAQVLCRGEFHWVVGVDHEPLPTADVYRAWDGVCEPSEVEPDAVLHALRTQDPEALGAALYNDLEAAAVHLRPALRDRLEAMRAAGALGAVVSGSGPTVVALAESEPTARRLAAEVSRHFDHVEVVRSPAGGPELLA